MSRKAKGPRTIKPRLVINRYTPQDFDARFAEATREHFDLVRLLWTSRLEVLRAELARVNGGRVVETFTDPEAGRLSTLIRLAEVELASAERSAALAEPVIADIKAAV